MPYFKCSHSFSNPTNQSNNRGYYPQKNKTKSQGPRLGINVGSASILLIFVILCLISFAVLSIVSSNADHKLTQKVLARTSTYYDACNTAQESLARLDNVLSTQYSTSANEEEYYSKVGHIKSYAITIAETQTLYVQVEILYPQSSGEPFYRITSWQTVTE